MNDWKLAEEKFEKFAENCANRIPCDDMACGEAFHCKHDKSEKGDCTKDKCPRLRWL